MTDGCEICKSGYDTYSLFVPCFGCGKHFHAKCVKLKATIADVLRSSDPNGLQWFCAPCRKTSPSALLNNLEKCSESAAKINVATLKLLDMVSIHNADVASLQERSASALSAKTCDQLIVVPGRRTRSSSCQSILQSSEQPKLNCQVTALEVPHVKAVTQPSPSSSLNALKPTAHPKSVVSLNTAPQLTSPSPSQPELLFDALPVPLNGPEQCLKADMQLPNLAASASTIPAASTSAVHAASASAVPASSASADPAATALVVPAASNQLPSTHHKVHLTVVNRQPKKAIFISRLASSTSEDSISAFIRESCNIPAPDLFCRKFAVPMEREIASFKIVPPAEYFNQILQQSFWPKGTFVREYKPRTGGRKQKNNNVVVIQPVSKN